MMNPSFAHLMVFVGSLLLLMLPDTGSPVSQTFREIPDAEFEQLCAAVGPCPGIRR